MIIEEDDFLQHFGVKGMQWGVRKDSSSAPTGRQAKKLAKADKKWQKNIYTMKGAVKVHNATAERMNRDLPAFNERARTKYPNSDIINKPNHKDTKAYLKEYGDLVVKNTAEAIKEVHGSSPSGKLVASLDMSGGSRKIVVKEQAVSHAALEPNEYIFELEIGDDGLISSSRLVNEGMAMSGIEQDEFLEHYGVKGMQWGVRNEKRLQRATRVADGTASKKDKAGFYLTDTSAASIRRNSGLKGAATVRAAELSGRKDRINAGKATMRDYVALKGGDRLHISGKMPKERAEKLAKEKPATLRQQQKARKEMFKNGQMSKEQYQQETHDFGMTMLKAGVLTGGIGVYFKNKNG